MKKLFIPLLTIISFLSLADEKKLSAPLLQQINSKQFFIDLGYEAAEPVTVIEDLKHFFYLSNKHYFFQLPIYDSLFFGKLKNLALHKITISRFDKHAEMIAPLQIETLRFADSQTPDCRIAAPEYLKELHLVYNLRFFRILYIDGKIKKITYPAINIDQLLRPDLGYQLNNLYLYRLPEKLDAKRINDLNVSQLRCSYKNIMPSELKELTHLKRLSFENVGNTKEFVLNYENLEELTLKDNKSFMIPVGVQIKLKRFFWDTRNVG